MLKVGTPDDILLFEDLLNQQTIYMGCHISNEYRNELLQKIRNLLESSKFRLLFSLDSNGVVQSVGTQTIIDEYKCWVFGNLFVRPGFASFLTNKNGIDEITENFIVEAENLGYYSYLFVMQAGKNWKNRTIRMRNQIDILSRYDYYDLAYVEANQKPKRERFWSTMGRRTWEVDLVIRTGLLKNEYRNPTLLVTE